MNGKYTFLLALVALAASIALVAVAAHGGTMAVLAPAGRIGASERSLMFLAAGLMALVVLPVFALTASIAWRYRAENTRAHYAPEASGNRALEVVWWAIPCLIITALAGVTWVTTHELDPYRPLVSREEPLVVQVVALNWKWLFIYPSLNLATLNYLELPVGRPITFKVTADAPMNSLWIPQLGGQIYAMQGMQTQLHLEADAPGDYQGGSANFSGDGFAGMQFVAHALPQADFDAWARHAVASGTLLTLPVYETLAKPSQNVPPATYAPVENGLFNDIIEQYMAPAMPGMQM